MPFEKGISGNPSGKPIGTPNKTSRQLRHAIIDYLTANFDKMIADADMLTPKERCRIYIDLMQYGLPRLSNVQLDANPSENKPIIIDWSGE